MRVAVTGGSGFIGSFLVDNLLKKGYEVKILDVKRSTVKEKAEFYLCDITDFDRVLQAVDDVDIIYHLAGTVLGTARKNPYLAVKLDILGTTNILEACVRNGVKKIIYASSFYIYDGFPSNINVNEVFHGDIFKSEFFGVVKTVGERIVLEYAKKYGMKYVILRFGPVYGPHKRCSSVICDFIKSGLNEKPIIIWGEGKRKNQYTYVENVAEGSVKALKYDNETFNLISSEYLSIRDIANLLNNKYSFEVKYDYTKKEGPSMPYISPKKAIEKLGWRPINLEAGIHKTFTVLKNEASDRPR